MKTFQRIWPRFTKFPWAARLSCLSGLSGTYHCDVDEKNNTDALPATPWHPLFALAIMRFAPKDRETSSEVSLSRLPLRVDIVVIQRENAAPAMAHKFRSIFDHTRKHTLIEYKGVTDDLEPADVFTLLAYAGLYMRERGVFDPEDVCLMVVADRIPKGFVEQIQRMKGEFVPVGNGLFEGHICGLPLHGVELSEAYKAGPSERLLYAFTRSFLEDHGPIKLLDTEEMAVYRLFAEHVQQLRGNRATMDMKDLDLAAKSYQDALNDLIAIATPEQRLAGLAPEQVFAAFAPEQRLAGLAPEQRLAGLAPEQVFAAFAPEQRLAGLAPEQILLTLPDDVLRALSPDYIGTLSDATRAAIRARIGR
jgi:hypothetical protein